MKKIVKIALSLVLVLSFGVSAFASSETQNIQKMSFDELTEYHLQLQEEYGQAVADDDSSKQIGLIEEGNFVLDRIVELAENTPKTRNAFGTTYYSYFSNSKWIDRNGLISLSIYPINLAWPSSQIETAWQFIVSEHNSHRNWKNESSLRKQFWCHVNFAGSMKTPWNIEPSKTSTNPFTCN